MVTGLRELWKLGPRGNKDLSPQAAKFKAAFDEQLQTINASLQFAAANSDPEWHKEQVQKRDKLISAYQLIVGKFADTSSSAGPMSEKTLETAKRLAEYLAGHKHSVEQSATEWHKAQADFDAAHTLADRLEEAGDERSTIIRAALSKIQEHANRKQHKVAAQATRKLAEGMRSKRKDKQSQPGRPNRRGIDGTQSAKGGRPLKLGLQTLFLSNFEDDSVTRLIGLINEPNAPTITLAVNIAFTNPGNKPFENIERIIRESFEAERPNPIRLTVYLGFHEEYANQPKGDRVHLNFKQCIKALNRFVTNTFVLKDGVTVKKYIEAVKELSICPSLEDSFEDNTAPSDATSNFEKAAQMIAKKLPPEVMKLNKVKFRRSVAEDESDDSLDDPLFVKIGGKDKQKTVTHEFHHILKDTDGDSDGDGHLEPDAHGYDAYSPDGPFVYDPTFERPDSLDPQNGDTPNPAPQTIDQFIKNVKTNKPTSVKEVLLWRPAYNLQKDEDNNEANGINYNSEGHLSRNDNETGGYGFSEREAAIARKVLQGLKGTR